MTPSSQSDYVCPVCGRPMVSANALCSGGFLDDDHPANVRPIVVPPALTPSAPPHRQPCECDACDAWFALPTDDDGVPVASDVAEDKRGLISEPSKCIGCCCPDCKGDPDA